MKKRVETLLLLALLSGLLPAAAQSLRIWKNGSFQEFTYDQVDSIVFRKPAPFVPVEFFTLLTSSMELLEGESAQIQARAIPENATIQGFKYSVSNKSIISVDENGIVTGLKTGNAFVVVKTQDATSAAKSQRCNVTVINDEDRTPSGVKAVDLGLPSGTLWANMNLDAVSETLPGTYFAWGETAPKDCYDLATYTYYQAAENVSASGKGYTKYVRTSEASRVGRDNFSDNITRLSANDDPAFKKWGGRWRTPTREQAEELVATCQWKWAEAGFKVKGPNGNSIFLPIGGEMLGTFLTSDNGGYWTSDLSTSHSFSAYLLYISRASSRISVYGCGRAIGHQVRAVQNK